MGKNAGQLALLAAGYFLGRSKNLRSVLLVASGVAYGRMTASRGDDSGSSLLGGLGASSLASAAREAVTSTATKGMESLNKNLQSRTEALRSQNGSADESESEQESDDSEQQSAKSTKSGEK